MIGTVANSERGLLPAFYPMPQSSIRPTPHLHREEGVSEREQTTLHAVT